MLISLRVQQPFRSPLKSGDADPTKGTVQTTVTYNVTYH